MTRTSAKTDTLLVGNAPAVFSTSTQVEVWPSIVWDTNAYYASLGVTHRATRQQLRVAYMNRNGHRSARLTYILKQLLDPEVRRKYDATPQNSIFVDDYVAEEVERILRQSDLILPERSPARLLDMDELLGHTEPSEQNRTQPHTHTTHTQHTHEQWQYGYYLKGDYRFQALRYRMEAQHRGVLRDWQTMLVAACASRGLRLEMGVGLSAYDDGVRITRVGSRLVVFLSASTAPNAELATAVATLLTGE
jgi:hypothetical protein